MNSVERVKKICKERKIPISKLERDLGYGNAYVSQLRKGVFPDNRLAEIADYLSVSVEFLMHGEEKEKPATQKGDELNYKERLIYDRLSKLTPENLDIALAQLDVLLNHQDKKDIE